MTMAGVLQRSGLVRQLGRQFGKSLIVELSLEISRPRYDGDVKVDS